MGYLLNLGSSSADKGVMIRPGMWMTRFQSFLGVWLFFSIPWAAGQEPAPPEKSPGKTICTISINSDDEKKAFQKHLSRQGFRFVELVSQRLRPKKKEPLGQDEFYGKGNRDWFSKVCQDAARIELKCDVLLISGHFSSGGSFFGASGMRLYLEDLEKHSCAHTCDGILRHPKIVYLFGCNTLSGSSSELKSSDREFNTLLSEGVSPEVAHEIANSEYRVHGRAHRERMIDVFRESPRIHGFNSTSPLGPRIANEIHFYFSGNPKYDEYLDSLSEEKSKMQLHQLSKMIDGVSKKPFEPLMCRPERLMCVNGRCMDDPFRSGLLCQMRNHQATPLERLQAATSLLNGPEALSYVPNVGSMLNEIDFKKLTSKESLMFESLKKNQKLKSHVLPLVTSNSLFSFQKVSWIEFAKKMEWITPEERVTALNRVALNLISDFKSLNSRDFFVSHVEHFLEPSPEVWDRLAKLSTDRNIAVSKTARMIMDQMARLNPMLTKKREEARRSQGQLKPEEFKNELQSPSK